MPLSDGAPRRKHIHTRSFQFEGFRREDDLYEIEGCLIDMKPMPIHLASGEVPAGRHIHEMRIRLTIDRKLNVLAAEAVTEAEPYSGYCETIAPDYHRLVGTNLGKGFRTAVRDLFGGVRGCAHLNEMLGSFRPPQSRLWQVKSATPTTLTQAVPTRSLHALDTHGDGVRRYYPRWYRGAKTGTDT